MDPARAVLAGLLDRLEAGWELRPVQLFDLRVSPGWGFGERRIPDWHLLYVRSGRGWYHLDGEPVALEPGRLLLLSPGYPHAARPRADDPPWIVPLRCQLLPPEASAAWRPDPVALSLLVPSALRSRLAASCDELAAAWQAPSSQPWRRLRRLAPLVSILLLAEAVAGPQGRVARDPFEQLRAGLCSHPELRPVCAELARRLGLSEKHLIRSFKARYGETPRAFQIRMRCERACWLLTETTEGVVEIARQLGYPDSASFCKQFKQRQGMSPGAWRRRHREARAVRA